MDSLDPLQEQFDGLSYAQPDPPRGSPAYPRMMIENRCYSTRVFRKIHFEVAWQQDGLQVCIGSHVCVHWQLHAGQRTHIHSHTFQHKGTR